MTDLHGGRDSARDVSDGLRPRTPLGDQRAPEDAEVAAPRQRELPAALASALRRAALGAVAGVCYAPATDVSAHEIEVALQALAAAVRSAAGGRGAQVRGTPPQVPLQAMLDRLRRSFVQEVAQLREPPDGASLLGALQAFERVQEWVDDASRRLPLALDGAAELGLVTETAHDMRSPLTSILFLVEMLRKGQSGTINTLQERQLGLVYSAAFGLSTFVGNLLDLAQGGRQLMDTQPSPFSVAELTRGVYEIVKPIAEEKQLKVRRVLPEIDARVGHRVALSRVLLNLVTNALKFTDEGEVVVSVRERAHKRVEFSVQDTGRGMGAETLAALFQPFESRTGLHDERRQGISPARLGLVMCRKLVRFMGGELRAESVLGQGSRLWFEVELPPALEL